MQNWPVPIVTDLLQRDAGAMSLRLYNCYDIRFYITPTVLRTDFVKRMLNSVRWRFSCCVSCCVFFAFFFGQNITFFTFPGFDPCSKNSNVRIADVFGQINSISLTQLLIRQSNTFIVFKDMSIAPNKGMYIDICGRTPNKDMCIDICGRSRA